MKIDEQTSAWVPRGLGVKRLRRIRITGQLVLSDFMLAHIRGRALDLFVDVEVLVRSHVISIHGIFRRHPRLQKDVILPAERGGSAIAIGGRSDEEGRSHGLTV